MGFIVFSDFFMENFGGGGGGKGKGKRGDYNMFMGGGDGVNDEKNRGGGEWGRVGG